MKVNRKLRLCIAANILQLLFIGGLVTCFSDLNDPYWQVGPGDDLVLLGVKFDTTPKYVGLLAVLTVINAPKVIIDEIAQPIIGFNIYNPDKKVITEFTKMELHVYGNVMYTTDALRNVIMMLITITRFDIAAFSALVRELVGIWTIGMLLNEKEFRETFEELV